MEDFENSRYDPEFWPFSVNDTNKLLHKWTRKISVDFATHIPPKMACIIGTFWNVFGKDELHEWISFKMLNELLITVWLKSMVDIVCVNTGLVFKLSPKERYYIIIQRICSKLPAHPERQVLLHSPSFLQ